MTVDHTKRQMRATIEADRAYARRSLTREGYLDPSGRTTSVTRLSRDGRAVR
jgi:hypothetical protein